MRGRAALLALLLAAPAGAEDLLREVAWDAGALPPSAEILPPGSESPSPFLRVRAAAPGTVTLLNLERPGVLARGFALAGRVRGDGTRAGTRLEMLVYGPPGGPWFSRHEVDGAPGWRDFRLPFRIDGDGAASPEKLVLNVSFAGAGTVELGLLRLLQCAPGEDPFLPGAWWNGRAAGWIGGILGTVLGLLGAAIGLCAGRGIARGFVLGALQSVAVLGFVLLAWGAAALALGQPYAVYYPLLLVGALCAVLGLSLPRTLKARYGEQAR